MNAKIRVLVIDDEAAILRFLKPALEPPQPGFTRVYCGWGVP